MHKDKYAFEPNNTTTLPFLTIVTNRIGTVLKKVSMKKKNLLKK